MNTCILGVNVYQRITVACVLGEYGKTRQMVTVHVASEQAVESFAVYVDEPLRFRTMRSVGSYFRLVPKQDQSAGRNRPGRITETGPATVRRLRVEAAWSASRC